MRVLDAGRILVPALLIGGGTGLIQYHSIGFWSDHVSHAIGWFWSVTIEAAGLWLWYRPGLPSRVLGLVASMLLLSGPLYQIAAPAIASSDMEQARAEASAQYAQRLRTELAQDAQLVRTYAQNSQHRQGWLPAIQDLQQRMDTARARLDTLGADQAKSFANATFEVYALVLLQALGLVLIQTTNVLAITHISRQRRVCAPAAQPAQALRVPGHERFEATASDATPRIDAQEEHAQLRELAARIRSYIEGEELSIARAAEEFGVDRRNLSYLLNWKQAGDRKPTESALTHLFARFAHSPA